VRNTAAIGIAAGLSFACGVVHADDVVGQPGDMEYVAGEVIIAFDDVPLAGTLAALQQTQPLESWTELRHAPHPKNDPNGIHPLAYVRVAQVPAGTDVVALSNALRQVPGIKYAHPNWVTQTALEPNDPFYDTEQYGPQIIEAPGAWDVTTGDSSVVLAVADTGLNFNHEDFGAGAIWVNPGEVAGNGVDDDGNGYIDDVNGWDALNDDNTMTDQNGHGSHVAGTAAARLDNGVGMAGMANVRIMTIQVFNSGGGGTWEAIAEAAFYATDNDASLLSYSGGGGGGDGLLEDAAQYAWDNGMPFVAAAGNNNSNSPFYPAYYPTVLAISGTDANDNRYTSSNYGEWLDVAAPGVNVFSCWQGAQNSYNTITGTSMSTPHVSGTVALMLSVNPDLTPQDVRDLLRENAVDLGDPGFDILFGWGRIDAQATLEAVFPPTLKIAFPEGLPDVIPPNTPTSIPVQVQEVGETIKGGTETLYERTGGEGEFVAYRLTPMGGGMYEAVLPAKSCGPGSEYYVGVETNEGSFVTMPKNAPKALYATSIGVVEVSLLDTFETDMGWTAENLGASSGDWQRGVPIDDAGWQYDPEADSDGSGQCFLTQNTPGNSDVDNGAVRVTSPVIDVAGGDMVISYDYYMYVLDNQDGADRLLVEVNDGNGWHEVASHSTNGGLAWKSHMIDQAALNDAGVVLGDEMQIRFTANDDGAQNIFEGGIDHVMVTEAACDDGCLGDFNDDGDLNILDFVAFQGAFVNGDDSTDCNDDGILNVLDFVCFQEAFQAGCG
jgi:subtilisin family serine protease